VKLEGRTAIITGAGSGIGLATARMFSAEGATVVAVDISSDRLEALRGELAGIVTVAADISLPESADRIVAAAGARIDVLFNNAGIMDRLALADEAPEELWDRVMAVNLTAPYLLCKRALPGMVDRGGGVIINTASIAGLRGGRAGAAYTASKFGVVGLTYNIAATYSGQGIRCNAICPGGVQTHISESDPGRSERGLAAVMRDRRPPPAPPEQIAEVALFLASDESVRVNGVALPVDAGWLAY